MKGILLPCKEQNYPGNSVLQYPLSQRWPGYSVLLVLLVSVSIWDSRIQKTNHSLLSIIKDQLANQLANIFDEYFQIELSIKFHSETSKLSKF